MAISSDATAVAASSSTGWAAGFLALLGETTTLFDRAPVLAFMAMGVLGAFAGWALMVETGRWDDRSGRAQLKSLFLRAGIGVAIGAAISMYYLDQEAASRGMWMLVTGMAAAAPIDAAQAAVGLLKRFLEALYPGSHGSKGGDSK